MLHILRTTLAAAALLGAASGARAAAPACPALPSRAAMPAEALPAPVKVDEWRQRSDALSQQVSGKDLSGVKLVFIGDSITQGWEPTMWNQFWGGYQPLNLGLWGDTTQGALFRLSHGQWNPTLHPQAVVLLIGTNNANWKSRPDDTALGIAEIIRFVRSHSPGTKVLLLGLLPRGADASAPERAVNAAVTERIKRCADGQTVVFLDPGAAFTDAAGRVSNQVLFDYLHPTMVGYAILGGAIQDQVRRLVR